MVSSIHMPVYAEESEMICSETEREIQAGISSENLEESFKTNVESMFVVEEEIESDEVSEKETISEEVENSFELETTLDALETEYETILKSECETETEELVIEEEALLDSVETVESEEIEVELYDAEDYRAWKQSDSRWGSIRLGSSSITMSSHGCLVTAVTKLIVRG